MLALPFADDSFEVVGAFDVLEHCDPEDLALAELRRVLQPGGRLLLSIPAYDWAWSDHDVAGYIADHEIPFNPLLRQGYLSIGCAPCTRPAMDGDDPRSGRWVGSEKTECGLHL